MTANSLTAGKSSGNNSCDKWQSEAKKSKFGDCKTLSFLTTKQMVHKFLTYDRMVKVEKRCLKYSKEELANKLGITLGDLDKLESPSSYKSVAAKIAWSLANLYCSTKWVGNKYEENVEG